MGRGRVSLGLGIAVALAGGPARAAVTETETTPYPGVRHVVRTDDAIPVVAHLVEIDLSSDELSVVTTAEGDRGQAPGAWAAAEGLHVAVNGDLHDPFSFAPEGLAFGGGAAWSLSADDGAHGFVAFDRAGGTSHAVFSPPEDVVDAAALAPAVEGVVGGRPMLVRAGAAESAFECGDALTLPCERAPRTAVGVSGDGNTLYLVVVDGWQAGSLGMTCAELAQVLAARGVWDALALDPGASSVLHVAAEGGTASSPSDGAPRVVANHVGIRYGMLPPGTMLGFIRERDVFDATANIAGATVTLDTGATDVTAADGLYQFPGLAPRLTCATASAPGYHSATQCRDVVSGDMTYNSIALFPNSDFIDASPGAPDASLLPDAAPRPDARLLSDGGGPGAADAGEPPPGAPACSCRAGAASRPGRPLGACLALLAAVMLASRGRVTHHHRAPVHRCGDRRPARAPLPRRGGQGT